MIVIDFESESNLIVDDILENFPYFDFVLFDEEEWEHN